MGSKSKQKHRTVDFGGAIRQLSDIMDQKFIQNTQHFTQSISSLRVRLEVLEDLLMEKLGETEASLTERVLLRIEKMQGFQLVDTPVQKGSVIRVKVKEEVVGQEQPNNPLQDAFMCVGHNQINAAIDTLVVGAVPGQTLEVVLPDPDNAELKRKITVTVIRVFKGEPNEAPVESQETSNVQATEETPKEAASS